MDKRIVTHRWGNNPTCDEHTSSNGFILPSGTYARHLKFLNELAAEAKKDFPWLEDVNIEPFTVLKSTYNQGFAGIRFSLPENTTKAGYRLSDRLDLQLS